MADVIGPNSTLRGSRHALPDGAMCDDHPDRPAVARVQGETDSFGAELWDMCAECLAQDKAYRASDDARTGQCDWCKRVATDLRDRRDFEEGMSGRVYRVCGECVRKENEAINAQWEDEPWDDYDDDDHGEPPMDCHLFIDNGVYCCGAAGSEMCDWECPESRLIGTTALAECDAAASAQTDHVGLTTSDGAAAGS